MNRTTIEWTDFTVNPIRYRNKKTGKVGHYCSKISPGCKFCYASEAQKGPYLSGLEFTEANAGKGNLFFSDDALRQVLARKKPCRIFWEDMSDLFGEWVPDHWIERCFGVMRITPEHTHQVLTKRVERLYRHITGPANHILVRQTLRLSWPLANVHLGTSVEDRARLNRIDILREVPAASRFVSFEPLLEDLGSVNLSGIDWAIIGGESGPHARPCNLDWIERLADQCLEQGVRLFVKQVGSQAVQTDQMRLDMAEAASLDETVAAVSADALAASAVIPYPTKHPKGGEPAEWPERLRIRQFPEKGGRVTQFDCSVE